jgi:hypothetical protein
MGMDIKKRGQPVYLNFFCFEETYTDSVLVLVEEMYIRFLSMILYYAPMKSFSVRK